MTSVLRVDAAEKCFGTTQALAGAGLELAQGEWLGLLGPNGAARENLAAFGELAGLRGATLAERIDWTLGWTALEDRCDEPVRGFSGGMKRRLNIACSVLHKPEVVLLDEPTVGVDPQSRERIWEMLEELRRGGASLLLTTHQLDEAQQVTDRIVIIDRGKDVATGTFDELVRETVGVGRRVTVALDGEIPAALARDLETEDGAIVAQLQEIGEELPELLSRNRDPPASARPSVPSAPASPWS